MYAPKARVRSRMRVAIGGFTLIELMVGVLVGMLTILVVAQALSVSEAKRRVIANGSDAQINGAMALYTLQRDIQMAGYGAASSLDALGCQVKAKPIAPSNEFTFTLAPVVIDHDPDGLPDKLTLLRARTPGFSVPIALAGAHASTDDHFTVTSSFGAVAGNMMIAVPKIQSATRGCTLFNVTDDPATPETKLTATVIPHRPGTKGPWNSDLGAILPDLYEKDDYLLNMGSMLFREYSVNYSGVGSSLGVKDLGASSSQDLYPQIVNLQALYGKGTIDPTGNIRVDSYDNITPVTSADWQRVVSIRVAIVARSIHYEKEEITFGPPMWDVGTTPPVTVTPATTPCNGPGHCIPIRISHIGDWKHFRFKIFDTIIPLRNVMWNS